MERREAEQGKRHSSLSPAAEVKTPTYQKFFHGAEMGIKEVFNLARVPSILMLGVVYVTYVLIGGVVFWKLEGELGQKDISLLLSNKKMLLTTYTCLNQEGLEAVAQVRDETWEMF